MALYTLADNFNRSGVVTGSYPTTFIPPVGQSIEELEARFRSIISQFPGYFFEGGSSEDFNENFTDILFGEGSIQAETWSAITSGFASSTDYLVTDGSALRDVTPNYYGNDIGMYFLYPALLSMLSWYIGYFETLAPVIIQYGPTFGESLGEEALYNIFNEAIGTRHDVIESVDVGQSFDFNYVGGVLGEDQASPVILAPVFNYIDGAVKTDNAFSQLLFGGSSGPDPGATEGLFVANIGAAMQYGIYEGVTYLRQGLVSQGIYIHPQGRPLPSFANQMVLSDISAPYYFDDNGYDTYTATGYRSADYSSFGNKFSMIYDESSKTLYNSMPGLGSPVRTYEEEAHGSLFSPIDHGAITFPTVTSRSSNPTLSYNGYGTFPVPFIRYEDHNLSFVRSGAFSLDNFNMVNDVVASSTGNVGWNVGMIGGGGSDGVSPGNWVTHNINFGNGLFLGG